MKKCHSFLLQRYALLFICRNTLAIAESSHGISPPATFGEVVVMVNLRSIVIVAFKPLWIASAIHFMHLGGIFSHRGW